MTEPMADSMNTLLIVDGGGVCRAPIVEFTLRKQLTGGSWLADLEISSRGLELQDGREMCGIAAARIGYSTRALAFSKAHRAEALTSDLADQAGLILTAERPQRAAVARLSPVARARTFTLKEALVLVSVLTDEVRSGSATRPTSLAGLSDLLHDIRGSIPLIEPPLKTSVFHRDRALPAADPLTLVDGHDDVGLHRHATDETYQVSLTLGSRMVDLAEDRLPRVGTGPNDWWWRQHA